LILLIRVSLLPLPLLSGQPKFKNFVLEKAMADKSLKLKVKGKVCMRAKWPIRPELIPVSVA